MGRFLGKTFASLVVTAWLAAPIALADSVSVTTRDAGGGQIEAMVRPSISCTTSCVWFAHAVERHASLSCNEDTTFIRWVGAFHESPGSAEESFVFRPFFPRYTKLCVFVSASNGGGATTELTITLPTGYGVQRSSANNCSNFGSQAAAQYYLYLYPSDPSGLDADNDGVACESNKCPCGAERIPPEPEPAPSTPIVVAATPRKPRAILPYISTDTFQCRHLKVAAGRDGWEPFSFDSNPFPSKITLRLTGPVGLRTRYVATTSKRAIRWGGLPAGRYRLSIAYPGDEWHQPSTPKILRPNVHACRR